MVDLMICKQMSIKVESKYNNSHVTKRIWNIVCKVVAILYRPYCINHELTNEIAAVAARDLSNLKDLRRLLSCCSGTLKTFIITDTDYWSKWKASL